MTAVVAAPHRSVVLPLIVIVLAGCAIAAVSKGVRTSFGLFTLPVTADSACPANVGHGDGDPDLVWGIAQPFAGAFADRYGTGRTVAAGLVVYAIGFVLMAISPNAGG